MPGSTAPNPVSTLDLAVSTSDKNDTNDNLSITASRLRRRKRRSQHQPDGATGGSRKFSRREVTNYKAHEEVKLTPCQNALSILALLAAIIFLFYIISLNTPIPKSVLKKMMNRGSDV